MRLQGLRLAVYEVQRSFFSRAKLCCNIHLIDIRCITTILVDNRLSCIKVINQIRQFSSKSGSTFLGNGKPVFSTETESEADKLMSVKNVLESWTRELTNAGVSEPEESVNLIVSHVFGKKMIHEVDDEAVVTPDILRDVHTMCQQRLNRVPVQYIIGEWDFHDLTLKMEPGVLIPRPETEELGSHVLSELMKKETKPGIKVLDIGCGTGALSLFILSRLSNVECVALDKNQSACDLTQKNAKIHSLQHRLTVIHGNIFEENCIDNLVQQGPFDMIVSNPPYIPTEDMNDLQEEVVRYEDCAALCGGTDGLDDIRQILSVARFLLEPREGCLWLEVDLSHPSMIENLLRSSPEFFLQYIETIPDFTNRDRFCKLKVQHEWCK